MAFLPESVPFLRKSFYIVISIGHYLLYCIVFTVSKSTFESLKSGSDLTGRSQEELHKFYFDIKAFKAAGTIKNSDALVDSFDENQLNSHS